MGIKIAGLRKRPKAKNKKPIITDREGSSLIERIGLVILLIAFLCALIFGKGGPGQRWYPGSAYESQRSGTR